MCFLSVSFALFFFSFFLNEIHRYLDLYDSCHDLAGSTFVYDNLMSYLHTGIYIECFKPCQVAAYCSRSTSLPFSSVAPLLTVTPRILCFFNYLLDGGYINEKYFYLYGIQRIHVMSLGNGCFHSEDCLGACVFIKNKNVIFQS